MSPSLIAYHGKPELKVERVAQVRWHREQDKLVKGMYLLEELAAAPVALAA